MTKKGYKLFDLVLLTVIGIVIECILVFAGNQFKFMVQGFSISFALLFALIGMFRWHAFGVMPGIGAGLAGMFMQNSFIKDAYTLPSIVGYVLGVVSTALLVFYLKKISKTKIKENFLYLVLYSVLGYICYIAVYGIVWALLDKNIGIDSTVSILVTRNLLNLLMSSVVLIIANKQRDFLVDMDEYLIKLKSIPESARLRKEINEDDDQSLMSEVVGSKDINDIALLDGGTLSEEELIKLNKTFKEKEGDNYGTRKS